MCGSLCGQKICSWAQRQCTLVARCSMWAAKSYTLLVCTPRMGSAGQTQARVLIMISRLSRPCSQLESTRTAGDSPSVHRAMLHENWANVIHSIRANIVRYLLKLQKFLCLGSCLGDASSDRYCMFISNTPNVTGTLKLDMKDMSLQWERWRED